jgi:hypothetical protein
MLLMECMSFSLLIVKEVSLLTFLRFLLAQIYFKLLDDKLTVTAIRNTLKQFQKQDRGSPKKQKREVLGQAFDKTMERINRQKEGCQSLAIKALAWITYAKRPLTTSELQHALAVNKGDLELDRDNFPQIEDMVSVCAGLVTIDEESDIIRLVHYTTQQYFEETQGRWFPSAKTDITLICVTYLSFSVFESGFCQTDDEFEKRLRLYKLYNYASQNWGYHAREASTSCQGAIQFLQKQGQVEASGQALMADKRWPGYSQEVPKQMTGLHLAAYFGIDNEVRALLPSSSPDSKDSYRQTPLLLAAMNGHEAVVKLLLDKAAALETKNIYSKTPLLWAAQNGHEAVVKLLLDKGAVLETKDNYSLTPLWWAAQCQGLKANARELAN